MRLATVVPAPNIAQALGRGQLLKWIGNKQRFAPAIIEQFPRTFGTYFEPFLGSGAVLGTLSPPKAVGSDACEPLMGIWRLLASEPEQLVDAYRTRWKAFARNRAATYETVRARFNREPNAEDLLFLSRSCYGGVIRFRKDGYMSTPVGVHRPIAPETFAGRVRAWVARTARARFECADFEDVMEQARHGDLVYCDPPYTDTQAILYGSQSFSLPRLFDAICRAKLRGAFVALSLDGHKKSGARVCGASPPPGLFARQVTINCGRSMLRRFQMGGQSLQEEEVADRLLLTW